MDSDATSQDPKTFRKVVNIRAPASRVWRVLTDPERMKQWMMADVELSIITDWTVGGLLIIRGSMNGKDFENTGRVLQFEPERVLQYSHLSSTSRLPDQAESYALIEFRLQPAGDVTALSLTLSNFPTDSIYHHLVFYWNSTLEVLKRTIEGGV